MSCLIKLLVQVLEYSWFNLSSLSTSVILLAIAIVAPVLFCYCGLHAAISLSAPFLLLWVLYSATTLAAASDTTLSVFSCR